MDCTVENSSLKYSVDDTSMKYSVDNSSMNYNVHGLLEAKLPQRSLYFQCNISQTIVVSIIINHQVCCYMEHVEDSVLSVTAGMDQANTLCVSL